MVKKRGSRQVKVNVYDYIKENSKKGHSLEKIKTWLVKYGYDEDFVSRFIKGFRAKQIAKRVTLSAFIVAAFLFFASLPFLDQNITGAVVVDNEAGCCIDREGFCHESFPRKYCNYEGSMYMRHSCFDISYCDGKTE
jgi:hypothetical protein